MIENACYLSNIHYELGTGIPLDDLPELKANSENLDILKSLGLKLHRKANATWVDMMIACGTRTLEASGLDPKSIQTVVYTTSSLLNHDNEKNDIGMVLCELGMRHAYPVGIFLSRCTNFSIAIQTSLNFIKAECQGSILLLVSDLTQNSPNTPVVIPGNISVSSDAAVCCLVSKDVKSGFLIDSVSYHTNQALWDSSRLNFVEHFRAFSSSIKTLIRKSFCEQASEQDKFKYLVTGNYNLSIQNNYATMAGFKRSQLFSQMLPVVGHAFACDQLISLSEMLRREAITNEDKIFLLGTGDYYFGTVQLTYKA